MDIWFQFSLMHLTYHITYTFHLNLFIFCVRSLLHLQTVEQYCVLRRHSNIWWCINRNSHIKSLTLYWQLKIAYLLAIWKSMAIQHQRINFVLNISLVFWSKNELLLIYRFLNLPLAYFMGVMNWKNNWITHRN